MAELIQLAKMVNVMHEADHVYSYCFINCKVTKDHCTYTMKYHMNVLSVIIYEDQTCLNHLQNALTDLLTLISKIVLENGTN